MNIQITNEGITINGETMQTGTAYADLNGVYFIVYKTGNAEQWRVGCYGTEFDAVKSTFARRLLATAMGGYHALRPNKDTPLCGLTVNEFPIEF